jgi:hypothetical protein
MPTTPTSNTVASAGANDCSPATCNGTCNGSASETDEQMLARLGLVKVKEDVFRRESASRSKEAVRQAKRRERLRSAGVRDVTLPVPEEHVSRLRAIMTELVSGRTDEPVVLFAVPARLLTLVQDLLHVKAKNLPRFITELEFELLDIEELVDRCRRNMEAEKGLRLMELTGWRGKIIRWISSGFDDRR